MLLYLSGSIKSIVLCATLLIALPSVSPAETPIPADLRQFFDDARYGIEDKGAKLRADNAANHFSIDFSGDRTTIETGKDAQATVKVAGYGWGGERRTPGLVTQVRAAGKRLDRQYASGLTEWFDNSSHGLEQGFVLARRTELASGPLRVRLDIGGGWRVRAVAQGVELTKGMETLEYAGLKAWDSSGTALAARMRAAHSQIEIEVDDSMAVYPLTVDPAFVQQAVLSASDAAAGNEFASSVALSKDGNTALINSPGNNAAYVFVRSNNGTWTQQQRLNGPEPSTATGDLFGRAVALSGDGKTALVAGSGTEGIADVGFVYVFTRAGSTWTEQAQLSESVAPNNFGWALSLSNDGNTALIGDLSSAFIFTRTTTNWTQLQQLTPNGPTLDTGFGMSVALSGDGNTALVAEPYSSVVEAFSKAGTLWAWQQELSTTDVDFGYVVAISNDGNTALVGAPPGAAFIFSRTAATWVQQQELIDPDFNPTGVVFTYGDSVALSADGSTALVSGSDALNNLTDVAYVFGRSNGTWTLDQQVTERTGIDGYSVALSGDATTALIGDYALNGNAGAAYAFALEAGASAGPPTVVSVTPNAGLASSQTFTAVYSDLNGAADLAAVSILFNVGVSAANACYVAYYPAQNALYLVNDAGTHFLTPTAPGSNTQVSNSQCTLSGKGSSYSTSGDTTSFTAALTFSRTPPEQIYLLAADKQGTVTGWVQEGTWGASLGLPAPVSVTPSSGSGVAQIFTATYSDPNGANDLVNLHLLLNSTLSSVNGCDILYKPVANALYLSDNGGDTFLAPITPGSATQASNNRCTISGTGSSYAASGNEGTLQVAVAFKGVVPEQNLTASDAAPFNKFGSAVAISRDGSIALIGSEGRSETNQDFAGAAYVFTQTAAGWTQQTELTGNDTYYGLFGSAVALSADGSTALVGAQAAEASSGRAYIFVRSGSEWNQQVELTSPNAEPGDIFGSTVALSDDGNTAVIADYRNVYVFTRSGSTWTEQQELTPPNSARDFGLTVALSGNGGTALIGAGQSNAAYVYTRSGSAWTLQQALAVSDQTQGFGSNVALSEGGNNALVVGPNGVYVFTRLGTAWTQQQKLTPADATSASNFGSSVALGNAGSTAMIGAPQGTSSNGAAYIFTRSGTTWSQQEEFVAANSSACCDSFGGSVAISATGTIVLVGDVTTNSNSGSVYAVKLGAPLLPLPTQNIYLLATEDNGSNSNWVQEGTWTP